MASSFSLALSCDSLWQPEVALRALETGALLQAITSDDPEERAIGRDAWATVLNTAAVVARAGTAQLTMPGSVCFTNLHANAPTLRLACVLEYRGPRTQAAACTLSLLPSPFDECFQFSIRLGFGESLTSGFSDSELVLRVTPADHAALRRRGRLVDLTVAEEDDEDESILSRSACKLLVVAAVQEAIAAAADVLLSESKGFSPLLDGEAPTGVSLQSLSPGGDPLGVLIPAAYLRKMLRCCVSALVMASEATPTRVTSPLKMLALGTGAGVLPLVLLEAAHRMCSPRQVECCCVDDSEGALTIADEWFGLGRSAAGRLTLVLHDAAAFVRREVAAPSGAAGTFAIIAVDLYSNGSWPLQAVGVEFWVGVAALLHDKQPGSPVAQDARQACALESPPRRYDADPVVVVNLDPRLKCFDAVRASLGAAFGDVCVVSSVSGGAADLATESNVVVVARTPRKITSAA